MLVYLVSQEKIFHELGLVFRNLKDFGVLNFLSKNLWTFMGFSSRTRTTSV